MGDKGKTLGCDFWAVFAVFLLALWCRLDNLLVWNDFSDAVFFHGQPLLTNFDGYYYLRLARDLVEGSYDSIDKLRAVPDYINRPFPPPLLSYILAKLTVYSPFSLEWIGVILPAVFGALLVFPLFGLGWLYGGRVCAYCASLLGGLSHYYVFRTQLGWLDTDCLIVFFSLGITLCFLAFGINQNFRRYLYLICGVSLYVLFLWWWDQATQVATFVAIIPLILALFFFYRPPLKEGVLFVIILVCSSLLLFSLIGWEHLFAVTDRVFSLFHYISKKDYGDFPNIGLTVAEQAPVLLKEAISLTTDSIVVFLLALAGLVILVVTQFRKSLFLFPYIALALFSLLFARRFLLFLGPVMAIGIGVFVTSIWKVKIYQGLVRIGATVAVGVIALGWVHREYSEAFLPQMRPELVAGMHQIDKISEKDAVVWCLWGYGYAMNYHARRATINDGQVHSGERTVYNNLPLATSDPQLAANFMIFYTKRGLKGMRLWYKAMGGDKIKGLSIVKKILAAGPEQGLKIIRDVEPLFLSDMNSYEDWQSFFYPRDSRKVYVFLDDYMVGHRDWLSIGNWNIANKDLTLSLLNRADLKRASDKKREEEDTIGERKRIEEMKYKSSVFYKLFVANEDVSEYFTQVDTKNQKYKIWEVSSDVGRLKR